MIRSLVDILALWSQQERMLLMLQIFLLLMLLMLLTMDVLCWSWLPRTEVRGYLGFLGCRGMTSLCPNLVQSRRPGHVSDPFPILFHLFYLFPSLL